MHPKHNSASWKPGISADALEELIDPTDKAEIDENFQKIFGILVEGKKLRVQAYKFDPSKLKKEKLIKKAAKKIEKLKNRSYSLTKENSLLKREIMNWEKGQKNINVGGVKKKLFKKPEVGGISGSLYLHEEFMDSKEMIWDLRKFNVRAEEVIKELGKEIEADTFKYE